MRAILAQAEWELSVSELPVSEVLPALLAALAQSPQVLLAAPTGAGKSTWLPLQLLQQAQLPGQIIMLEPRRWRHATWHSGWRNSWVNSRAGR